MRRDTSSGTTAPDTRELALLLEWAIEEIHGGDHHEAQALIEIAISRLRGVRS